MVDTSKITQQIRELRGQRSREVTLGGASAVDTKINDLLREAGNMFALEIDSGFVPNREGNQPETMFKRRQFMDGLKEDVYTKSGEKK